MQSVEAEDYLDVVMRQGVISVVITTLLCCVKSQGLSPG